MVDVNVVLGTSFELLQRLEAGTLDLALVTAGNTGQRDSDGEIVYSEPLKWAGLKGGIAHEHTPLPLALSGQTCAWRAAALAALDKAGLPYRIAYTSEHCVGQAAALHADLAIAPFPASLVTGPLVALGEADGLPDLGTYHILLHRGANGGTAIDALAGQVVESFAAERSQTPLMRAGRRA
jgi:DNA-binding transcriptional LysR family regulator